MKKMLVILFALSFVFTQTYMAGDVISETHQNQVFDICYGDYGSEQFSFADLNGAVNGGSYYIIFIDMAATW